MALHSSLTDPNLHEPKGVAAASTDEVYVADGLGSGSWESRLPTQTSNAGKLLTTNGTTESWSSDSSVRVRGTVTISGTTVTLKTGSVNVTSVIRNSTGNYTINFTNNLASTNYDILSTCRTVAGSVGIGYTNELVSSVVLTFYNSIGASYDPPGFSFVIYGGF